MGKREKLKENDGNGSGDGAKWGSATLARRVTIVLVLLALLGMFFLSGCIVSLGTPLVRKIEQNSWIIEGGVGPGWVASDAPGVGSYVYVGRGLGEHFEIGILPYGYVFVDTGYAVAFSVPVKWDPFAYESPFHMTFFAGPVLYTRDWIDFNISWVGTEKSLEYGLGGNIGLGLSYYLSNVAELYASASILGSMSNNSLSGELGSRFFIFDRSTTLGVGIIFTILGAGLGVTIGTVL